MQVSNTLYTFVDNVPSSNTEIQTDNNLNTVALHIQAAINKVAHNPGIASPSVNLNVVNVKATFAGVAGDSIPLVQTGGWATIVAMSGGKNADTSQICSLQCTSGGLTCAAGAKKGDSCNGGSGVCVERCDEPRNAIIKMDFNEAMMPNTIGGKVVLNGGVNGVGQLDAATSFNIIGVQADMDDPVNGFQNDDSARGTQ